VLTQTSSDDEDMSLADLAKQQKQKKKKKTPAKKKTPSAKKKKKATPVLDSSDDDDEDNMSLADLAAQKKKKKPASKKKKRKSLHPKKKKQEQQEQLLLPKKRKQPPRKRRRQPLPKSVRVPPTKVVLPNQQKKEKLQLLRRKNLIFRDTTEGILKKNLKHRLMTLKMAQDIHEKLFKATMSSCSCPWLFSVAGGTCWNGLKTRVLVQARILSKWLVRQVYM